MKSSTIHRFLWIMWGVSAVVHVLTFIFGDRPLYVSVWLMGSLILMHIHEDKAERYEERGE